MQPLGSDRKPWLDLLLRILALIFSFLFGGTSIAAVTRPGGVGVLALDPASKWFWILAGVLLVLALATWAFQWWRERQQDDEDELLKQILDFVQWVLTSLEQETGRLLREIPQSTVEEAARQVYRSFIANTPLAIVPEGVFVDFVVERWKRAVGVNVQIKALVARSLSASSHTQ